MCLGSAAIAGFPARSSSPSVGNEVTGRAFYLWRDLPVEVRRESKIQALSQSPDAAGRLDPGNNSMQV